MKRILLFLLSVFMLIGLYPLSVVAAEDDETVLLAFGDFQHADIAEGQQLLGSVLDTIRLSGTLRVDGLLCNGDYSLYYERVESEKGIRAIKETIGSFVDGPMIFSQGNHDPAATEGLAQGGNNDAVDGSYGVYVVQEDDYSERGMNQAAVERVAADMAAYLEAKLQAGWTAPIFIINHIPLHWGNLTLFDFTASNGYVLFNVLNEYGEKGLNIIHLYGHSHAHEDDFIGGAAVYLKKGDTIPVGQDANDPEKYREETLHFTYMNAGYMGYYSTNDKRVDDTMTATLFRIRGDEVIITRYDAQGEHDLKSAGVFNDVKYGHWQISPQPNLSVYPSSRLVTATDDVAVETPVGEQPVGLAITKQPNKTAYLLGESLDLTGLSLSFVYEDGTLVNCRSSYETEGFASDILGDFTLTISCGGLSTALEYRVLEELPDGPGDSNEPEEPSIPKPPVMNGWFMENDRWVYYSYGVKQYNQWRRDSVGWCYLGSDGYCVTNMWVKDSRNWCYLGSDGRMVTNKWIRDSVGWCYVGYNGYCVTNKWVRDSVGWCYLGSDCRMVTNAWVMDSVGWCYVGGDGYCVTSCWQQDSVGWCYLDKYGRMVYDSWLELDGITYYIKKDGYRATGIVNVDGKDRIFAPNGKLIW